MAILTSLAGALFVAGCATAPAHLAADDSAHTSTLPSLQQPSAEAAPEPAELDSDLLYRILLAEIAAQRERMDVAVREYSVAAWDTDDPHVAERATRMALYAKDYTMALRLGQRWLELAPDESEAQKTVGLLHLRAAQHDKAAATLRQWAEAVADTPTNRYELITALLLRETDRDAALAVMRELAESDPTEPEVHLAVSRLAAVAGDLETARSAGERTVALQPDNAEAKRLLARIRLQQGDTDAAVELIGEALEATPDDSELRLDYARMLLQAGRHEDARRQFQRLKEDFPDNGDILYALGLLALEEEAFDQAEAALQRLIELDQRVDEAAYYLGGIAAERADYDAALEWYRRVEGSDLELEALIQIANVLAEQGDLKAARDSLHAQRESEPSSAPRLYMVEAELLRSRDGGQEAMRLYDEAIGRFPDNPDLLYARALLGEQLNRPDVLERDLRRVIELDPENAHALNALGYTFADRNERLQEAYELIKQAYDLRPEDAAIIDSMGWIHYRLGKLEEAEQYLRQALATEYDGEIAGHLGEVLWMRGKREEAEQVWDEALDKDPENPALQKILKRFRP